MLKIRNSKQKNNGRLFLYFAQAVLLVILSGCEAELKQPTEICPGKQTLAESLDYLNLNRQNAVPLKGNGWCLLQYYVEGKKHKENFPVKLWVNPPAEFYLQGDVAFNPRGVIVGSNEREFWLLMRPKAIRGYRWGRWSTESSLEELRISPKTLLEVLGAAAVDSEENWSLSNEGPFDVLTKRNDESRITKKIYIYSCDYQISKIEYFDSKGEILVVVELYRYKEAGEGFFVPGAIRIITPSEEDKKDTVRITLKSVKPAKITEKKRSIMFTRPEPKGFEHVYEIIEGKLIEQGE